MQIVECGFLCLHRVHPSKESEEEERRRLFVVYLCSVRYKCTSKLLSCLLYGDEKVSTVFIQILCRTSVNVATVILLVHLKRLLWQFCCIFSLQEEAAFQDSLHELHQKDRLALGEDLHRKRSDQADAARSGRRWSGKPKAPNREEAKLRWWWPQERAQEAVQQSFLTLTTEWLPKLQ